MKNDRFDVKNIMATTIRKYNGNEVLFDINGDVTVNATQMAKPFGKYVKDWLNLQQTQEYIKALIISREGISPNGDNQALTDFANIPGYTRTVQGGKPSEQGTWINRKLALRFAQWLNPTFAVWVDTCIEELLEQKLPQRLRQMLESGELKLDVQQIKGIHGGTYTRKLNVYEAPDSSRWGWEEFTLGAKTFTVPVVIADGHTWVHGPAFLRETGLVGNEGDIQAAFASIDYRLMRRYSPFGKSHARHFIRKDALSLFGFVGGNQAAMFDKTRLKKKFIEIKEAMPGFEERFIHLIDSVKTMREKEFLIDLYRMFK